MRKSTPILALAGIIMLAGCAGTPSNTGEKNAVIEITNQAKTGSVINPEDVTVSETLHSLEGKRYYNTQVLPSTGDVNVLVIPILIPGYTDFENRTFPKGTTDEEKQDIVKEDIKTAFFGTSDETGWQSVSSFYKESSFGKLNLSGTVTDWFDASTLYSSANEITISETYNVVEAAVNWALSTQDLNVRDFDSDNDGFIDGVWCVYSAEDYANNGPMTDDQNYWAYTTWGNQDKQGNPANNEYYYKLTSSYFLLTF